MHLSAQYVPPSSPGVLDGLMEQVMGAIDLWHAEHGRDSATIFSPFMLIASALHDDDILIRLPLITDEKQKATLACQWVPTVALGTAAYAAVIAIPGWIPDEPALASSVLSTPPRDSSEPPNCVSLVGVHADGDTRAATASLVEDNETPLCWYIRSCTAGLWAGGLLVALGACAPNRVRETVRKASSEMLSWQFPNTKLRDKALRRLYGASQTFPSVFYGVDKLNVSAWCFSEADAKLLKSKVSSVLGRRRTLTDEEKSEVLHYTWAERPLLAVGFTMQDLASSLISDGDLQLLEQVLNVVGEASAKGLADVLTATKGNVPRTQVRIWPQ